MFITPRATHRRTLLPDPPPQWRVDYQAAVSFALTRGPKPGRLITGLWFLKLVGFKPMVIANADDASVADLAGSTLASPRESLFWFI